MDKKNVSERVPQQVIGVWLAQTLNRSDFQMGLEDERWGDVREKSPFLFPSNENTIKTLPVQNYKKFPTERSFADPHPGISE